MIIRKKPSYAVLTNLYDTIRELYKDEKFYYTSDEQKKIIENKSNVIITREEN